MMIDDHAIDRLRTWYDIELDQLVEEHYIQNIKLTECPSYKSVQIYRQALNILIKGCYLPEYYEQYKIPATNRAVYQQACIKGIKSWD